MHKREPCTAVGQCIVDGIASRREVNHRRAKAAVNHAVNRDQTVQPVRMQDCDAFALLCAQRCEGSCSIYCPVPQISPVQSCSILWEHSRNTVGRGPMVKPIAQAAFGGVGGIKHHAPASAQ